MFNRYSYTRNDPVNMWDPYGLEPFKLRPEDNSSDYTDADHTAAYVDAIANLEPGQSTSLEYPGTSFTSTIERSEDGSTVSLKSNLDNVETDVNFSIEITGDHQVTITNIEGTIENISRVKIGGVPVTPTRPWGGNLTTSDFPSTATVTGLDDGRVRVQLSDRLPGGVGRLIGRDRTIR